MHRGGAFQLGHVRDHVLIQRIGDVGVAQGNHVRRHGAGGGGEGSPDFRIAGLRLVADHDALLLADGLVEGVDLMIDNRRLRAGSTRGPEQDLDGFVSRREAAHGKEQRRCQQDTKKLFHGKTS